jgi:hypothetical protein
VGEGTLRLQASAMGGMECSEGYARRDDDGIVNTERKGEGQRVITAAEPGKTFKIVVFEAGEALLNHAAPDEALYRYRHRGGEAAAHKRDRQRRRTNHPQQQPTKHPPDLI